MSKTKKRSRFGLCCAGAPKSREIDIKSSSLENEDDNNVKDDSLKVNSIVKKSNLKIVDSQKKTKDQRIDLILDELLTFRNTINESNVSVNLEVEKLKHIRKTVGHFNKKKEEFCKTIFIFFLLRGICYLFQSNLFSAFFEIFINGIIYFLFYIFSGGIEELKLDLESQISFVERELLVKNLNNKNKINVLLDKIDDLKHLKIVKQVSFKGLIEIEPEIEDLIKETEESIEKKAIKKLPLTLTPENLVKYNEFKSLFNDTKCIEHDESLGTFRLDDETFMRFFIARDFNIKKAKTMLDEHIEFRNKYIPSQIKREELGDVLELEFLTKFGYSLKNEPILISKVGNFDPHYFKDIEHFTKFILYVLERVTERDLSVVKGVTKGVIIIDISGLSLRKHWNSLGRAETKQFVHIVQDHNPERLSNVFILKAPSIFSIVWKFICLFLDAEIKKKVVFVNNFEQLESFIDKDNLFKEYGGNKQETYTLDTI